MSTSSSTATSSLTAHSYPDRPPDYRRSSAAAAGTLTPIQACAACKYQRRKCTPDCILAPYFPADKQRQFISAHRLFGVSNILKTIRGLDETQRNIAMRNIIFQSDMRAGDPVGGCYRIIHHLHVDLMAATEKYNQLSRQLNILRAQTQAPMPNHVPLDLPPQHQQPEHPLHHFGGESSRIVPREGAEIHQLLSSSPLPPADSDLGGDFQRHENGEWEGNNLLMDMFEPAHHHQQPGPFPAAVELEEVDENEVSTLDFRR